MESIIVKFRVEGYIGFRDITPIIENQRKRTFNWRTI